MWVLGLIAAMAILGAIAARAAVQTTEEQMVDDTPETPSSDFERKVMQMALAISRAEGYGADPDNIPTRRNNPLDIMRHGVVVSYPTYEDGLADGLALIRRILSGHSQYYNLDMTLAEMAQTYTGAKSTEGANLAGWIDVVSRGIGITPETTLREYVG